jgi:hypothetical protein
MVALPQALAAHQRSESHLAQRRESVLVERQIAQTDLRQA